jgi:DNA-binding response OmpR family regulator
MSRVVLLALPEDLAAQLGRVLLAEAHQVSRRQSSVDVRSEVEPDVVFLYGDCPDFLPNLAALREAQPPLPVIVVTRLPDVGRWLDALDAGAADYCGAPFERVQVRWILETVCNNVSPRARQRAAA